MVRQLDEDIGYASPNTETPSIRTDFYVDDALEYDIVASTDDVKEGETFPYSKVESGLDAEEVWVNTPKSSTITSVATNSQHVFAGYNDGDVVKFEKQTGDVLDQKTVHTQRITDIDTDYNGNIATASLDGRVIKNNASFEKQWEHSLHDDPLTGNAENVNSVSIHTDSVYSGSETAEVIAVNSSDGSKRWEHNLHTEKVTGVSAYTVESVTVDSSAIGDTSNIINIDSVDVVFSCSVDGFIGAVYARDRTFTEDGNSVSVSAADARWSVDTQLSLRDIDADENVATCGDNGIIASYSDWNGDEVFRSNSLSEDVLSIEVDGRDAYVGTDSGTVQGFDMGNADILWRHSFHDATSRISGIGVEEVSGDTYVYSGATDSNLRAVDGDSSVGLFTKIGNTNSRQVDYTAIGDIDWRFTKGEDGTHDLGLSNDGDYLYAGTLSGSVISLDRVSGEERWRHSLHGENSSAYGVAAVESGTNEELVVSGGTDDAVRLYDGETNSQVAFHGFHNTSVYSVSADNGVVYSTDANGVVYSATIEGDILSFNWEGTYHSDAIYEVTAYNGVVYTASADGTAAAVNASDGSVIWQVELHDGRELRSIDADDNIVVSGGFDNSVVAMNPSDGSEIWRHSHHYRNLYGVQVGNDGVIYSGAYDNHVRAAGRESGKLLWSHAIQDNSVRDIKYIDGQVMSASWDGTVISVDNAIFYPFEQVDSERIRFVDKHAPSDFSQDITYGIAADDGTNRSQVRTTNRVNVPFRFNASLNDAINDTTTRFVPDPAFFITEEKPTALAGGIGDFEDFVGATFEPTFAFAGSEISTDEFILYGTLQQELQTFGNFIEPTPFRPTLRANQINNLILPTKSSVENDFAQARDEPIVRADSLFEYNSLASASESKTIFIDKEIVNDEIVFASDVLELISDPDVTLGSVAGVDEDLGRIFAGEVFDTVDTDSAQVKLQKEILAGNLLGFDPLARGAPTFNDAIASQEIDIDIFLQATAFLNATAAGITDYFDFNEEVADISQLIFDLETNVDDRAQTKEDVEVTADPVIEYKDPFIGVRELTFSTVDPVTFLELDRPVQALVSDIIAGVQVDQLEEEVAFTKIIDIALEQSNIEYMVNDTVPLRIQLPGDLNNVDSVKANIVPVTVAGDVDIGGEASIINADKGEVLYRFDRGETSESGAYALSWEVEYNELTQQTFPRDGPMQFTINPNTRPE